MRLFLKKIVQQSLVPTKFNSSGPVVKEKL